jgi:hypothetical protein
LEDYFGFLGLLRNWYLFAAVFVEVGSVLFLYEIVAVCGYFHLALWLVVEIDFCACAGCERGLVFVWELVLKELEFSQFVEIYFGERGICCYDL